LVEPQYAEGARYEALAKVFRLTHYERNIGSLHLNKTVRPELAEGDGFKLKIKPSLTG
jgi:hypothetical protein